MSGVVVDRGTGWLQDIDAFNLSFSYEVGDVSGNVLGQGEDVTMGDGSVGAKEF